MPTLTTPEDSGSRQGNTVPIVAILAGALVGVVSPVAVAAVARRTRRELDASAQRQRVALDASAERQRAALDAERERLETTLVAQADRQRRETERVLLDRGTTLISEFRDAVAYVTLDARGQPIPTDRWRQAVHALAAFRGRLLLWFEEDSEIVKAFDGVTAFTSWSVSWAAELRGGEHKVKLTRVAGGNGVAGLAGPHACSLEDVDLRHLRYVVAARAHLLPGREEHGESVAPEARPVPRADPPAAVAVALRPREDGRAGGRAAAGRATGLRT